MANTNLLTTVEQCDTVLAEKAEERGELIAHKSKLESLAKKQAEFAVNVPEELASLDASITDYTDELQTLDPDSNGYRSLDSQVKSLQMRRNMLLNKADNYDALKAFDSSADLQRAEAEIASLELIITEVTNRRTAITAGN